MAEDALNLQNIDINKAMDLTSEELKALGLDKDKLFDVQQKATFAADQALGVGAGALTGKKVDNSVINEYIAEIEKPAGTDVYSKQAAMYRARGEGDFLRTQKNLANLFLPTLDLIKKREAAAMARFTLLKNRMPEFDDTTIFGDQSGNPMPIADEIKNISSTTKEDLRQLSRLNPMDERYDEIKKRVEKNQKVLVSFDNVNQKLLEIRNAGTDESQWSRGMDETTANMWRDIYTSNGKNIKIVGDKLVWTDTKGTTKTTYNIPDDNTTGGDEVYDDATFNVLYKSRGDDPNSEQYKRSIALSNLHWFSEQIEHQGKELNDSKQAKKVQNALNALGFTDDDGNALEVDGKFGPKSKQAYKKYLAQKGDLNKQHLDQYMTEEDAAMFRTSTTTGVGETRVIDLEQIGDGPTMINNKAVNQDILIRGNAQELINSGVGLDDPMYNTLIKQQIFELNNVGPEGIKSLISDGLRNDPDSIYNGINTDEFVEQVIRNHYGDDLTQSEIEEKIELMRAGDVTQMYNNGKGGQDTLQTQFMEWYKGAIDKQIEEGVKSKLVGGAPTGGGGVGGGGGGGGGGGVPGTELQYNNVLNTLQDNPVSLDYGVRGKHIYKNINAAPQGGDLSTGEIYMNGTSIGKIAKNGSYSSDLTDLNIDADTDFKLTEDTKLLLWNKETKEWEEYASLDSRDSKKVKLLNSIIEYINDSGAMGSQAIEGVEDFDIYTTRIKAIRSQPRGNLTKITNDGTPLFGLIREKGNVQGGLGGDEYILDYDDEEKYTIPRLTESYGRLGFKFEAAAEDKIKVTNKLNGKSITITTDRYGPGANSRRESDEDKLINFMQEQWDTSLSEYFSKEVRGTKNNSGVISIIEADSEPKIDKY